MITIKLFFRGLDSVCRALVLAAFCLSNSVGTARSAIDAGNDSLRLAAQKPLPHLQLLLPVPDDEPAVLLATEGGGGGGDSINLFPQRGGEQAAGSEATIIRLEREMEQTRGVCGNLPPEYQADCLQQGLSRGARALSGPEYSQARREISSAQRRINSLVTRNVDRSKPPIRVNGRTYRAVKKSEVARVNREARRIVAETETRLLRSAGASGKRKVHYQRIARAVGSTKNLLRS